MMVIWQEARAMGVQVAWCAATSFKTLFASFMCFTLLAIDKESELSKGSGTDRRSPLPIKAYSFPASLIVLSAAS